MNYKLREKLCASYKPMRITVYFLLTNTFFINISLLLLTQFIFLQGICIEDIIFLFFSHTSEKLAFFSVFRFRFDYCYFLLFHLHRARPLWKRTLSYIAKLRKLTSFSELYQMKK